MAKDPQGKIVEYDSTISPGSPARTSQEEPAEKREGEMSSISEIQSYLCKYSTTSSVFAEQSISNPDYQKTLYCISCILQAELFDDLAEAAHYPPSLNPELNIVTALPPHLGGLQPRIPDDVLARETADDMELRVQLLAGNVPTVDTILRFISWLHQSAKYSAQCNIIAFIYIKRMMDSKCVLTMNNWRGMWLGAIILAQKVWDDASLRTSSFASILPGVTKHDLKALEVKIFKLLNYGTSVKPSIYARFYFELREIFKTITGELVQNSNPDNRTGKPGRRRPLTMKNAQLLKTSSEDPRITPQCSKQTSPRSGRTGDHSSYHSNFTTGTQSRASMVQGPPPAQSTASGPAPVATGGKPSCWLPATSPKGRVAQQVHQDGGAHPNGTYAYGGASAAGQYVNGQYANGQYTNNGQYAQGNNHGGPYHNNAYPAPGRSYDDGAGTLSQRAAPSNLTHLPNVNTTGNAGDANYMRQFMTTASTPSHVKNKHAQAARQMRPFSLTFEDATYTKSTIFVIS